MQLELEGSAIVVSARAVTHCRAIESLYATGYVNCDIKSGNHVAFWEQMHALLSGCAAN